MSKIHNISTATTFSPNQSSISETNIQKTFGRPEDHVELHIFDLRDNLLQSVLNFTDYFQEIEYIIIT